MSSYKDLEMKTSLSTGVKSRAAIATDHLAMPLYLIPQATTEFKPLSVGSSISFGGSAVADTIVAASTLAREIAAVLADEAA
jgi:hypothetical protein